MSNSSEEQTIIIVNGNQYPLTSYMATGIAEGFEEAESGEQVMAAWQYLVLTGMAWQLQGSFGRAAQGLLDQGIIETAEGYDPEEGIYIDHLMDEDDDIEYDVDEDGEL